MEEGRRSTLVLGVWLVPLLGMGNLKLELTRSTREVGRAYFPMRILLPALAGGFGFLIQSLRGGMTAVEGLYALAGALALTLLAQEVLLGQALPREGRQAPPEFRTRFWLSESFPLLLIAGFVILLNQTDIIMVGALAGDEAVGLYASASVTARWVSFMLLSANAVAAPLIAGLHAEGEKAALQALVTRVARWTFWPSLALAVILILPWVFGIDQGTIEDLPLAVQRIIYEEPDPILLKCSASPHIYLLEQGEKRWINNIETFNERGYVWRDVIFITCDELRSIPDGIPIPADAGPPPQP